MTIDRVLREFTDIDGAAAFDEMAGAALAYQYAHNAVYRRYCDALRTPAARLARSRPLQPPRAVQPSRPSPSASPPAPENAPQPSPCSIPSVPSPAPENTLPAPPSSTPFAAPPAPENTPPAPPSSTPFAAPPAPENAPSASPSPTPSACFSPAGLPLFLPVEAFKQAAVTAFPPDEAEKIFESSGTGRGVRSRHYVRDVSIYERALAANFSRTFGTGPFLFALCLPGYAEQGASSLIYMAYFLMRRFGAAGSGSILGAPERLRRLAGRSADEGVPLVVFGAAFGLLDLVETATFSLPSEAIVIETGGMKTRRREIARADLHGRLQDGFGVASVCSEYGMCELLDSCYAREGGVFCPPPWMRFWVVDPAEPFAPLEEGREGALALLDLANVYSASALLTGDRAVQRGAGFEVLGRLAHAELRGCNFLLDSGMH